MKTQISYRVTTNITVPNNANVGEFDKLVERERKRIEYCLRLHINKDVVVKRRLA